MAGGRQFTASEVPGDRVYSIRQQFESPLDEAFDGLGQHQNAQMNYKGEDVELAQHNMDVDIYPGASSPETYQTPCFTTSCGIG